MKPISQLTADELDRFEEMCAACYGGLLSKVGTTARADEAVNQARQLWDAIEKAKAAEMEQA